MSKMVCRCGAVLSNTRFPCPTEGSLCGEADEATAFEDACKDVGAFFAAVRNGARDGWIAGFFSPDYPVDTRDEEVVCDIIAAHTQRVSLSVAECPQCGRLWVQRASGENRYGSYAPDEPGHAGVLCSQGTGAA